MPKLLILEMHLEVSVAWEWLNNPTLTELLLYDMTSRHCISQRKQRGNQVHVLF
ncbi:hypothetical protein CGLO_15551 [Colletotrichum gloeosporioides Cg-14]|uniref:Uncharacterized protein n=1 Tax=Colletotrichum gloeosporioides (strain Cg-14) TaxID=1237896 RepID=T0LB94_COLGC|nr:hypothetical protein CGLO_15551 [Colletotrichum gloeosporioides Cg-14]